MAVDPWFLLVVNVGLVWNHARLGGFQSLLRQEKTLVELCAGIMIDRHSRIQHLGSVQRLLSLLIEL